MSRAVSMRPDLYAAYLHGASLWDGEYAPIAENGVAVYLVMAENDEYYGSQKAREVYEGLRDAYRKAGWTGSLFRCFRISFDLVEVSTTRS